MHLVGLFSHIEFLLKKKNKDIEFLGNSWCLSWQILSVGA
jgi:hypothetical protein